MARFTTAYSFIEHKAFMLQSYPRIGLFPPFAKDRRHSPVTGSPYSTHSRRVDQNSLTYQLS